MNEKSPDSLPRNVTASVRIDADEITDWNSFHDVFARDLRFPCYYGRNMDAWIDCMTYLDDADSGMTAVTVKPGELFSLELLHAHEFSRRCPKQFTTLVECMAFVNFRRRDMGGPPVLVLLLL